MTLLVEKYLLLLVLHMLRWTKCGLRAITQNHFTEASAGGSHFIFLGGECECRK